MDEEQPATRQPPNALETVGLDVSVIDRRLRFGPGDLTLPSLTRRVFRWRAD